VGFNWTGDIAARVVVSAALMILPTLLFGSTFPLVVALEANRLDTLGRRLGTVYAANTLGAIGGSLVGGFVLLPWLGMQRSQQALAVLLVLVGAAVLLGARQWTPRARWASAAGLFAGTILAVSASEPWNQKLLSLGVFFTPQAYITPDKRLTLAKELGQDRLLYYREGRTSTVAVLLKEGTHKSFRVDGKPEMSTLPVNLRLGRMMKHLPMLLHPKPRVVLNIGLGSGMTVAAVAAHPAEQIDVAEIEPLVSNAARLFAEEHYHVLDDRRVHLIFNDGRNHLLLTDRRYDVITPDPIEPSVAGAASLFTVDHFRIARSRLAPGGIMCQFLPLYELEPREYQSILRSFAAAFPHVTVWWTGDDTFLIGSEEPITIDFARLATQVQDPSVRNDLDDVGLADPYRLLATFLFALKPGDPPTTDAPLNTDNHPYVEFTSPKRRWMPTVKANHEELLRRKSSLPDTVRFPSEDSAARAVQFFKAQQLAIQALIEKANKDSPLCAGPRATGAGARSLQPVGGRHHRRLAHGAGGSPRQDGRSRAMHATHSSGAGDQSQIAEVMVRLGGGERATRTLESGAGPRPASAGSVPRLAVSAPQRGCAP